MADVDVGPIGDASIDGNERLDERISFDEAGEIEDGRPTFERWSDKLEADDNTGMTAVVG